MPLTRDFERRLVDNIQPIRHFFLAQAIHHALELGVFRVLRERPVQDVRAIAGTLGLDEGRVNGLLHFLENEGFVVNDPDWTLTTKGSEVQEFAPWYQMLVGGYATTMLHLAEVMKVGAAWATRDTKLVGIGSCGIGRYDAVPLVLQLLDNAHGVKTVVDLGCGDAGFLMDILSDRSALKGLGVEPHQPSIEAAKALRCDRGMDDRLELFHGPASDVKRLEFSNSGRGVCFMTAFVLQEMLEQEGEVAVEKLLCDTFNTYPESAWLVVEMDYKADGPIMTQGLGLGFYNPYFLIHTVTEQRLESRGWWNKMFARAGLRVADLAYPDSRADNAGVQFGVLLTRDETEEAD